MSGERIWPRQLAGFKRVHCRGAAHDQVRLAHHVLGVRPPVVEPFADALDRGFRRPRDVLVPDRLVRTLCDLKLAEPKTLRHQLLHAAARITRGQRRIRVRIDETWPWATHLATACTRLNLLPAPT